MARKEYRSSVRSRELMCEAMLDLICEKNINDITIKELVERARIDRSTFYVHYKKLDNVVEAIGTEMLEFLSDLLKQHKGATITPEMVAQHILKLLEAYPQWKKIKNADASFCNLLQRVLNQYFDLCLQEAPLTQREDNSFRAQLQFVIMLVYYGMINCATETWSYTLSDTQTAGELISMCRKLGPFSGVQGF